MQVHEQKVKQRERLGMKRRWLLDRRSQIGNQVRETGGQCVGDWQKEQFELLQSKREGIQMIREQQLERLKDHQRNLVIC